MTLWVTTLTATNVTVITLTATLTAIISATTLTATTLTVITHRNPYSNSPATILTVTSLTVTTFIATLTATLIVYNPQSNNSHNKSFQKWLSFFSHQWKIGCYSAKIFSKILTLCFLTHTDKKRTPQLLWNNWSAKTQ